MLNKLSRINPRLKQSAFYLFLASFILLQTGCGKNGTSPIATLVNDVKLKTFTQGTDQWMEATIMLTTGGFSLTGINLPIINPANPAVTYGDLTLVPNLCTATPCNQGGELTVAVNLTAATQTQGEAPLLPNGTVLPVGGLQNASIVTLPIAQTGAKIYLAFGKGVAMFGAAVPFAALDPAGKYVPGVDVFEPLTFNKISLIAGIFAGSTTNTTGVGLFVDLSSVLNQTPSPTPSLSTAHPLVLARDSSANIHNAMLLPWKSGDHSVITLGAVKPSLATERKLYQKIYNLSKRSLTLRIE